MHSHHSYDLAIVRQRMAEAEQAAVNHRLARLCTRERPERVHQAEHERWTGGS